MARSETIFVDVFEEVEAAHFVGAVVRAVARAHAAVVGHLVDAFALWLVASTGQTGSQGAFSQCMHSTGWKYDFGVVQVPS
jgi:hypothetical protein